MLRLTEAALFLAPALVVGLWLWLGRERGPSRRVVAGAAAGLAVLAVALLWLSREDLIRRPAAYVPAQAVDGRIVPGHAE